MKCRYCDRDFIPRTRAEYCSDECRKARRREVFKRDYEKRKLPPAYKFCLFCSTKFLSINGQRYCEAHRTSTFRDKVSQRTKGERRYDDGRYPISECYARLALAIIEGCDGKGPCTGCVVDGWCRESRLEMVGG